ncbi:hypothetical protein CEQ90_11375 [Lewinellaceae bacterium SD302]|nr:hypothetical protein CEQ90_11375 [Lewinellaceae bacterium SD302]
MPANRTDLIIMGAGLTGLTLAYLLRDAGLCVTILEARDRVGGRIYTIRSEGEATREMGATWLGKKHRNLVGLLEELGLGTFEQQLGRHAIYEPISTSPHQLVSLPPNDAPSFRITGGSDRLIEALRQRIGGAKLRLNHTVTSIYRTPMGKFRVATEDDIFESDLLVSTLPPRLFADKIGCEPALPKSLCKLMEQTHTWMGESIKVSFTFAAPFWRQAGLSGTMFSNVGPLTELYDHSDANNHCFALKGFLNGAYYQLSRRERCEMALQQLEKYYGGQVRNYLSYDEVVWRAEPHTFSPYTKHVLPHQNNGHADFREGLHEGRFFIAGSETAAEHPGYMDGAVQSAYFVAEQLSKLWIPSSAASITSFTSSPTLN